MATATALRPSRTPSLMVSHSDKGASPAQEGLLRKLSDERGTTYTENDVHCRTCASTAIDKLIKRTRDRTDYRPSRDPRIQRAIRRGQ